MLPAEPSCTGTALPPALMGCEEREAEAEKDVEARGKDGVDDAGAAAALEPLSHVCELRSGHEDQIEGLRQQNAGPGHAFSHAGHARLPNRPFNSRTEGGNDALPLWPQGQAADEAI